MSIGLIKQTSASVPTPPSTEENLFIDAADDKLKKKLSSGTVVDLEGLAGGVTSFNGRTGVVSSIGGDYEANQITNVPSGSIVANDVQAAINELDNEKTPIAHVGSGGAQHADANLSVSGFMSAADKTKLDSIASGATANQTDAYLLDRSHHTNTQLANTISDFSSAVNALIPVTSVAGKTGVVLLNKNDVGLSNVDNTSDINKQVSTAQATADSNVQAYSIQRANHTGTQLSSTISDFSSATQSEITSQKGIANGIVPLNGSIKIDSTYLPAYVDDVLEFANLASFPVTGTAGIIYIALDTNKTYRWSGSTYVEISGPPANTDAVPEGTINLYFTEPRVLSTDLLALPTNNWNIVAAADTILQAIGKLSLQSMFSPNTISTDTTVPSGYTWLRQDKTIFSGTTKITIQSGAKLKFI